jgi:hypothetical protein
LRRLRAVDALRRQHPRALYQLNGRLHGLLGRVDLGLDVLQVGTNLAVPLNVRAQLQNIAHLVGRIGGFVELDAGGELVLRSLALGLRARQVGEKLVRRRIDT